MLVDNISRTDLLHSAHMESKDCLIIRTRVEIGRGVLADGRSSISKMGEMYERFDDVSNIDKYRLRI